MDPVGGAMGLKVIVGSDRSRTSDTAVEWAADLADRFDAELFLVQVLPASSQPGFEEGRSEPESIPVAQEHLARVARQLAGPRGQARVIQADDAALGLVRVAEEEHADILVVGNVGMADRKQFLLGNVPNRVSHLARCNVVIVNSATGEPVRGCGGSRQECDDVEPEFLLTGRAAHITRVLGRLVFRELRARRGSALHLTECERARLLRDHLEQLGPTFCKLGQILSTRPDLLPPAYIEELGKLQDHVHPLDEPAVVKVMEEELGVPWEDVFETIDPQPLAAGTIAQVHRATMSTGERVVIKVQRPEARNEIMRDLALFDAFARRLANHDAITKVIDVPAIVEYLSISLEQELDFQHEAANIERMREILAPYARLDVPRVHSELTTRRLLVMEEIPGVPISRAPDGPLRKAAARQLVESYYRQVLTEGFFHADPHPGNLMWCDDKLYLLDLGMVGEVNAGLRENLLLLLLAFWREDEVFLAEIALSLAGDDLSPGVDVAAFRADLGSLMARSRHVSLGTLQLGAVLQEMTQISLRHGVRLPSSLVLSGKALAQMQLATACLDPELDPFAVAGTFMARSTLGSLRNAFDPQQVLYEARKLRVRLVRALETFERLSGSRPGPKLQVQFRGIEGIEANIRRAGRHIAIALAGAGALVATAMIAISDNVGTAELRLFGALSALLVGWLVVDVGRRR